MNDNNDNGFTGSSGKIDPSDFKLNINDDIYDTSPTDALDELGKTNRMDYSRSLRTSRNNLYEKDKSEKTEKKEHKKRDKIKAHKNRRVFRIVWLAMVILIGLALASYLIGGSNDFFAIGRTEGVTTVTIPENVTVDQLTDILDKAGAIKKPEFFKIYCSVTADMEYFEPGTYNKLQTNMDYEAIINYLQGGEANLEVVQVVLQEGMTLQQIAQKLEDAEVIKAQEFMDAAKTNDFDNYDMIAAITNASDKYYKLEGYLFPDTYQFYKGEKIDSVMGKLLNDFQTRITSDIKEDIDNSQYSMDQIITIASIIQAEAANSEDMYNVSSVIRNRIERGGERDIYTLGCDSTIYYPYSSEEEVPTGFTSNYNTYNIQGLPAGPICSPGLEAIRAALNPNDTDYFYFCHSAEGEAYYAETAEGHDENLVLAKLA